MQLGMVGLGPHGRQHRAPPHAQRSSLRGLRPQRRRRSTRSPASGVTGSSGSQAISSPSSKSRAPSGSCCRPARSPRPRSRSSAGCWKRGDIIIDGGNSFYKDDIRRAQELEGQRHPLCRLRHQRRRLGPRARLLHDDRRRQGRGRPARSDLQRAGARRRRHPAHAGPRWPRSARRSAATCIAARAAPGISSR